MKLRAIAAEIAAQIVAEACASHVGVLLETVARIGLVERRDSPFVDVDQGARPKLPRWPVSVNPIGVVDRRAEVVAEAGEPPRSRIAVAAGRRAPARRLVRRDCDRGRILRAPTHVMSAGARDGLPLRVHQNGVCHLPCIFRCWEGFWGPDKVPFILPSPCYLSLASASKGLRRKFEAFLAALQRGRDIELRIWNGR